MLKNKWWIIPILPSPKKRIFLFACLLHSHLITDELDASRDRSPSFTDANEQANKLTQRMRDLYDFKTENEWPKRTSSHQENTWISKSSSEEEKTNYRPVRRNSQDLEFNDRTDKKVYK